MKVIVTGGRTPKYPFLIRDTLDRIHKQCHIVTVVHGDCQGTDTLAQMWADDNGVKTKRYPADWEKFGKSAGPIRNKQMLLEEPDLILAFPGGKGTRNMIAAAKKAGYDVAVVTPKGDA